MNVNQGSHPEQGVHPGYLWPGAGLGNSHPLGCSLTADFVRNTRTSSATSPIGLLPTPGVVVFGPPRLRAGWAWGAGRHVHRHVLGDLVQPPALLGGELAPGLLLGGQPVVVARPHQFGERHQLVVHLRRVAHQANQVGQHALARRPAHPVALQLGIGLPQRLRGPVVRRLLQLLGQRLDLGKAQPLLRPRLAKDDLQRGDLVAVLLQVLAERLHRAARAHRP